MPLHETAFLYVECDVPAGVTLEGWRAAKAPTPRRRPIDLLLRRASRRPRTSVDPVHDSASTRE
jgi:hypothetical protein